MARFLLFAGLFFQTAALFGQSCVPSGARLVDLTDRIVRSVEALQSADPVASQQLIQQMKDSLGGLQEATECFAARAQKGHDACLQQVGQTTLELGKIEKVEKQLGDQLKVLQVDLARAAEDQRGKKEALDRLRRDIDNTRRSLDERRRKLDDYDWLKYVCPPCKLLAEAITNDENTIRRLEADIRALQAQGGSLDMSTQAVERTIGEIVALRASLQGTVERVGQMQVRTHSELGEMKGTTVFFTDANKFWRGVGQILTLRAGPELRKAAQESEKRLGSSTGAASFSRPGSRPAVAANSLKESLVRFAKATDEGSNFLLNPDTSYCTALPRSIEHLPLVKQNPTAPALTVFNGRLFLAFQSNDGTNSLNVTSSADGNTFEPVRNYPAIQMGSAPALAVFQGMLMVAFQANDASHNLYITATAEGHNFQTPARRYPGVSIGSAPALAVFKDRLYVAFQANDSSHTLHIASMGDVVSISSIRPYPEVLAGSAPALAAFKGRLYAAFQANDPGHALYVMGSDEGTNFAPQKGYQGIRMGSSPGLAVLGSLMYVTFQAEDASHTLHQTMATNPASGFVDPATPQGLKVGSAVGMTEFNGRVYAAFRPNDLTNAVTITSTDGNAFSAPQFIHLGGN